MKRQIIKGIGCLCAVSVLLNSGSVMPVLAADDTDPVVLRVCNWEEYIDEGDWDADEVIDLDSGDIFGENPLIEDFQEWYFETYGKRVIVEYSCFGTNEELYNMLTLGDEYDLVCPSEYMIMKLMSEDALIPYSSEFFDEDNEYNYYINNVSPYIRDVFENSEISGEAWEKYAAGYMWGVTGILYNPEEITKEEASTWDIINNPKFSRQVTVKDNVRDTFFAAVGAIKADRLMSDEFRNSVDYHERLKAEMNDVSQENIEAVQEYLQSVKDNVYSFESDSGKADMITGKVLANYQWSGDAVYAMDQAEEDDFYLEFAVPEECTNLWFDGWVMLEKGIGYDPEKQAAAEAFVNFMARPDNAIRNMYYIGYTSVIAGNSQDSRIFEYLEWNYASDEEEDVFNYPVGYFFSGDNEDEDYIVTADKEQLSRQLFAQYPTEEVIKRSAVMQYFDKEANARINQMWINVRCYNIKKVPVFAWIIGVIVFGGLVIWIVKNKISR